jgi:hypothetical protein
MVGEFADAPAGERLLQEPTDGAVAVFGNVPGRGVAFWRGVATTVESPSWYHGLSVREHLDLVRVANGADPGDGRIDEVFELVGLRGVEDGLPMTLSSGQRQRFLLAAMFVRPSRLLVRVGAGLRRTAAADTGGYHHHLTPVQARSNPMALRAERAPRVTDPPICMDVGGDRFRAAMTLSLPPATPGRD